MDFGSALMAVLVAVVVKGAVMGLSGWLIVRVYRAASSPPPRRLWLLLPEEDRPEVRILWWALVLFFVSELTCGIEIYVLFRSNALLAAIHAGASAAGMGLFSLGILRLLDRRLFKFAEPACLANRICRGCTLREPAGCRFRVALLLAATFASLAALAPMFASTERMYADPRRYALPFESWNRWYDGLAVPWLAAHLPNYRPGAAYFLPEAMLVIEFRLLPLVSLALSLLAIARLRRGQVSEGARTLSVSAGVLCYSLFELVLYRGTGDVILGSLGHEAAEFWFLVFTAEFLRRCFAPRTGERVGDAAPAGAVV